MRPQECCVLIPSLSPDGRLPAYVRELRAAGYGLVLVVDDGSAAEYQPIFEEIAGWDGCRVLHHQVNRGKGAALKTGFAFLEAETDFRGVLTADSDGQHTVPDTLKLTEALGEKEEVLLGSRDFSRSNPNVPPKSRFGNRLTSGVFHVLYGQWLPDTQTGLRAFPRALLGFLQGVKGDRFEYEMNMLMHCRNRKIPLRPVSIQTIYHEENKGTHFQPVQDSWRIYKLLLGNFFRFMSSSLICWLVDILLFTLLTRWEALKGLELSMGFLRGLALSAEPVLLATVIARIVSASLNFKLNKDLVFNVKKSRGAVGRYIALCVGVMLVSGVTVGFLKEQTGIHSSLIKMLVDLVLFFVNYRVQRAWVFPAGDPDARKGVSP